MTAMVPDQRNFTSGEVSPLLRQRIDFQRTQAGARTARGFVPLPQGGITRAPGTIYRGETRDNKPARVISFEFAENDALVLELTAGYMRPWRYGTLVDDGGSPYELAVPWSTIAEIRALDTAQAADVIFIASGERPTQMLSRAALDDWSIAAAAFNEGPFQPINLETGQAVQCSAATGTINVTLTGHAFDLDYAGALLRVEVEDFQTIPIWTADTTVSVGAKMRYDGRIYELTAGTNTGANPPIHQSGTQLVDQNTGAKWKYLSGGFGVVRLDSANAGGTVWSSTVLRRIPDPCVSSTSYRWALGAWADPTGYPTNLEIYDQRMFAGGTREAPRTMAFSVLGDFTDFTAGVTAEMGGAYTISGTSSLNAIQWLYRATDGLYVGALGEIYRVFPSDAAAAVGPTNMRVMLEGSIGVSQTQPIMPYGAPVVIEKGRLRLVELRRQSETQVTPTLLSLPAAHLAAKGMEHMVWQTDPTGCAWIARPDAGLTTMVYLPEHDVLGWASVPLSGGRVESLTVTPDPASGRDVVTMVVAREIGAVTRYFIEELADNQDILEGDAPISGAVHLHAALVFDPAEATDSFSLPHLGGETVWAWTDQGTFGPLACAANGDVVLPGAVSHAVIGLFDDTEELETLSIHADAPDGSPLGRLHRLHHGGGIALHRTADGTMQWVERDIGRPERVSLPEPLVPRDAAAATGTDVTGVRELDMASGHASEISLRFRPVGGAPLTITAIAPPIEETGP